jgi:hypothetical protein
MKLIGIKIIRSIKSEKSLRLMVHISETLKIEGTPIQIPSKILRLAIYNDVKILKIKIRNIMGFSPVILMVAKHCTTQKNGKNCFFLKSTFVGQNSLKFILYKKKKTV